MSHIQIGRLPVQTPWALGQVYWRKLLYESPYDLQVKLIIMQRETLGFATSKYLTRNSLFIG